MDETPSKMWGGGYMRCPTCKGKGHVYRPLTMLCILTLFIAPFERNDPDGFTRKECPQCDGECFI